MTTPIRTIDVTPRIPEALHALFELSNNLWFVWNYDGDELFRRMGPELWEETRRNPVEFLCRLKQQDLLSLAGDEGFLAHLARVKQEFDRYVSKKPNGHIFGEQNRTFEVAYFTAECGLADCLSIYSGGLGILSGDHLKSASDLNLPIVGVSLAYQNGYFRQYLTQDGWQMETYPENKFATMPMKLLNDAQGNPVTVAVDLKGETVNIQAWQVDVGRIRLYLLDTNINTNREAGRSITFELYGGDREMRIRQEIILGIGGARMLRALGVNPAVFHMNEGHSAFAIFERIRQIKEDKGLTFEEALEYVRATSVFTTHTPVPAGNDYFNPQLMRTYFEPFAQAMGISYDLLTGFGKKDPRNKDEEFCMTVLALRLSSHNNGVSRLHARVSRKMWQGVWPNTPEIDLPIAHITNGIHTPSWISQGMADNYNRYLGPRWIEDPDNVKVWERVDKIPDTELWRTHEQCRDRLITFARRKLREQMVKRGVSNRDLAFTSDVLSSEVLTIGFARRFASYKRANLVFRDIGRLKKIVQDPKRPVQFIFAGKAHPQDKVGKELIKNIVQVFSQEDMRRYAVFLEDYDMELARYMVQGADVWLNTPRRPLEACGTSGMKAVANGALHLSVLDGWWFEGYHRDIGWAIGGGEQYDDDEFQDDLESRALYDMLEKDVIPLFYDRGPHGLPRGWIAMMKSSLHKLCPVFNTHRMVEDYWDQFYLPAAKQGAQLMEKDWEQTRKLASWWKQIMYNWGDVAIREIRWDPAPGVEVGSGYHIEAVVSLGELQPQDVIVDVYYGRVGQNKAFVDRFTCTLQKATAMGKGMYTYQGDVEFEEAGHFGLNIRVTPNHPNPESRHAMGLVVWGRA